MLTKPFKVLGDKKIGFNDSFYPQKGIKVNFTLYIHGDIIFLKHQLQERAQLLIPFWL